MSLTKSVFYSKKTKSNVLSDIFSHNLDKAKILLSGMELEVLKSYKATVLDLHQRKGIKDWENEIILLMLSTLPKAFTRRRIFLSSSK